MFKGKRTRERASHNPILLSPTGTGSNRSPLKTHGDGFEYRGCNRMNGHLIRESIVPDSDSSPEIQGTESRGSRRLASALSQHVLRITPFLPVDVGAGSLSLWHRLGHLTLGHRFGHRFGHHRLHFLRHYLSLRHLDPVTCGENSTPHLRAINDFEYRSQGDFIGFVKVLDSESLSWIALS